MGLLRAFLLLIGQMVGVLGFCGELRVKWLRNDPDWRRVWNSAIGESQLLGFFGFLHENLLVWDRELARVVNLAQLNDFPLRRFLVMVHLSGVGFMQKGRLW